VLLSWQTATEHNNTGFAVLRRAEQEPEFRQVAFVAGAGNKLLPSQYQYHDETAPTTPVYYRLQQVDLDGAVAFSPMIAVKRQASAPAVLTVAPVPADQYVAVTFSDPSQPLTLQLLSLDGRVLQHRRFQQQAQLDVSHLAAGLYMLQALNDQGLPVAPRRKIIIGH
jgi:hypothetical protein